MEKRVFVKLKGQGFVELHDGVHNYVKIVKTRKDNECFLCRGSVKKGEEALVWQSQDGPMRHYTRTYYCKQCFEVLERTLIDDLPADIQPYASLKDDGGLYVRLPEDYDLFNEEARKKRDEMAEWLLANGFKKTSHFHVYETLRP